MFLASVMQTGRGKHLHEFVRSPFRRGNNEGSRNNDNSIQSFHFKDLTGVRLQLPQFDGHYKKDTPDPEIFCIHDPVNDAVRFKKNFPLQWPTLEILNNSDGYNHGGICPDLSQ